MTVDAFHGQDYLSTIMIIVHVIYVMKVEH
jgi:hypothetical protein